ncbi:Kinectin [Geodia barretti]|uniref:Kinectin n=1 Tax=Geodia barretti TaxID=519541 RepID=A0AA35SFT7_GEOBA|nr:Kinectin [Geodia barretti]CAI8028652.1 Kinectin [Geodia barretti]CAI8028654.1 Kinectin [Geodia barretti]
MEEESLSMLTVVVPAVVGVSVVVVTVVLVFWLGAGRQTSYEDAMKARQGHADRELRKITEREREQKQKREKKRPGGRSGRRQESGKLEGQQGDVEVTPLPPAQKGILKTTTTSKANSVAAKDKAEPSAGVRVDFEVSETPAKPSKTPRTNPPTPHPSAQRGSRPPFSTPLARALEPEVGEEEEEDEEADNAFIPRVLRIEPPQKKSSRSNNNDDQVQLQSKPKAPPTTLTTATAATKSATVVSVGATKSATTTTGGATSRGQKKTKKSKSTAGPGELEAMPASRISDVVSASTLSNEEIQHLIDKLLEMQDANAEWKMKGASKGTESVKSLKKANEDLQERCQNAENTVRDHYQKIKKLEVEIAEERSKRQTSERQLQLRISKQTNEITIFKTKLGGLEEELKLTKQLNTSKLEEENSTLTQRMNALAQENSSLTSQLASLKQSLQESQEQSARLHSDLRKAKSAAKSPAGGGGGADGRGQLERVGELEQRLRQVEEDNASLQAALISVGKEKDQLVEQVQSLVAASQERDTLSQQLSSAQQLLQETQVAMKTMEQKEAEGEAAAGAEISRLEQQNAQLGSQVDALRRQSEGVVSSTVMELRQLQEEKARLEVLAQQSAESAAATAAEVQRLRETNAQLGSQVEGLQQQSAAEAVTLALQQSAAEAATLALQQPPPGPSQEEVEEMKSQLKEAHEGERQAVVAKMEAEHSSEVSGLKVQYEAELLSVKEELSRVRREGEAERSSTEQRLASETAMKQDLQSELEKLQTSVLTSQQNGPLDDQVDAGHEEELRAKEDLLGKVAEERDTLKERLKTAETNLNDLQGKNNSLRDNCWKARDDSARLEKESEAKLKQVYRDTESRVKMAEARVAEEKEEGERALLERLFPDVRVAETTSFSPWVDQFEMEAQLCLENTKKQVCELKQRVAELEEDEQIHSQEAQGFRETLNKAFGNLEKLQEQVTTETVQHHRLLEEREEMLQRERVTNRDLQQQLSKERETTTNLEAKIKEVGEGGGGEERVREMEGQLEKAAQSQEDLHGEVDRLTASLDTTTQLKTHAEDSAHTAEEQV